jgi:acetate kinase
MKILTLNCGSSSIKYTIWEMPARKRLCSGIVDRVSIGGSCIKHESKKTIVYQQECPTHEVAIKLILRFLTHPEYGILKDVNEIDVVAHRVVHGGEKFNRSVKINDKVIEAIEECSILAPLHNPPNLLGIRTITNLMPQVPQIAIFDTAFFSTLPKHSYIYPLPYEWYERYKIRRYGFHGTSHLYVSRRASALLHKGPSQTNLITLHIGNGVSITAIREGAAFDHSMGFTPLEGAVMGTRCGDIDPSIPLYIMQKENINARDMENILNKKSGLLGITGKYVDRRDILKAAKDGDVRCQLALELECYRLKKYIGAYAAALGEVDAIVFTAGVGENSPVHRAKICENLDLLGIKIDSKKNELAVGRKMEMDINVEDPRYPVKVFVIPTNEELVFAEDAYAILNGKYDVYTNFEYIFQKEDFIPIL